MARLGCVTRVHGTARLRPWRLARAEKQARQPSTLPKRALVVPRQAARVVLQGPVGPAELEARLVRAPTMQPRSTLPSRRQQEEPAARLEVAAGARVVALVVLPAVAAGAALVAGAAPAATAVLVATAAPAATAAPVAGAAPAATAATVAGAPAAQAPSYPGTVVRVMERSILRSIGPRMPRQMRRPVPPQAPVPLPPRAMGRPFAKTDCAASPATQGTIAVAAHALPTPASIPAALGPMPAAPVPRLPRMQAQPAAAAHSLAGSVAARATTSAATPASPTPASTGAGPRAPHVRFQRMLREPPAPERARSVASSVIRARVTTNAAVAASRTVA